MLLRRSTLALVVAAAGLGLALGCGSGASPDAATRAATRPDAAAALALGQHPGPDHRMAGGNKVLPILTRNLYLGADLTPVVLSTDIPSFLAATTAVWDMVNVNSFALRAEGIADEIAAERPALVGLQEAYTWLLAERNADGSLAAPQVKFDDVQLLVDALAARGRTYRPVASVTLFQFSAPILTGQVVTLVDHGVILAREDVHASHPTANVFQTLLPLQVQGQSLQVPRGWVSVEVKYRGERFRFVSTHLESFAAPIRSAQAAELVAALAAEKLPVVLVGDLNSVPGEVVTLPSGANVPGARDLLVAAGGFHDTWAALHPSEAGFTCCFPEDLRKTGPLDQRIDYVLFRGGWQPLEAEILGAAPAERVSGLWPSDHAGLAATLRILDPRFH